jgi:nicotinamidase/pyrazinamidase
MVYLDIDTQIDFVYPAGALYVPGAEKILPVIASLNRHAAAHNIPLFSTACLHAENDPEFQEWPPHCIEGTVGQQKPAATLVDPARQVVLTKQHTDVFRSPEIVARLTADPAAEYFVYGVVTEVCVKFAALGLLAAGRPVTVVTDAIQHLHPDAARAFLDDFVRAGGKLTTSRDLIAGPA